MTPPNLTLPSDLITARIAELTDWRGPALTRIHALIHQASPDVYETWKWRGVPVWEQGGIICPGEIYNAVVNLTFANGVAMKEPKHLFNSSLDGNSRLAFIFVKV